MTDSFTVTCELNFHSRLIRDSLNVIRASFMCQRTIFFNSRMLELRGDNGTVSRELQGYR